MYGSSEAHAALLFGSGALLHDDLISLAQSTQMCPLHFSFFSAEGISWQWTFRIPRPRSLLRNPMSITSTPFGTLCWNFCFTHISAYQWKRYFARKIWVESHVLVISHWTSYATKNEPAYERKTHPSTTSRTSQAGLEMTKDSITLDNNDSQSLDLPTIRDWTILDWDQPFSARRLRT